MRRLFKPGILKRMVVCGTQQPRHSRLEKDNRVYSFKDNGVLLWDEIKKVQPDLFKGFNRTDRILIKVNLNTADPYPASTSPDLLRGLLEFLKRLGFTDILVGDCSSIMAVPTRRVFKKTGLAKTIEGLAQMVCFDQGKWVRVPVAGEFLNELIVPNIIYQVDHLIYLANLKTHRLADFSLSLKLGVGLVHPLQRYDLHGQFLQEKVAETALAVQPDLVFLDAREAFITLGPEKGEKARGDFVFAGRDLLAVDLEGYRLLYELKEKAECLDGFTDNPFEMRQFKHAQKILGWGLKH